MNPQISVIPSIQHFIMTDGEVESSLLNSFCRNLEQAHMQLGIQSAADGWGDASQETLQSVMHTVALLYEQLSLIKSEVIEYCNAQ